MKKIIKKISPFFLLAVLLFADQFTKAAAVSHLKGQSDYPLLPGILEFSYLENTGAAFSSFMGKQGFLILLTSCAMCVVLYMYYKIPSGSRHLPMRITFILVLGGGIGNLIDRLTNGYVVDFIYFVPINFPKFNFADIYVSIGMIILIFLSFFYYTDDELEFLFPHK